MGFEEGLFDDNWHRLFDEDIPSVQLLNQDELEHKLLDQDQLFILKVFELKMDIDHNFGANSN
ncbi:hypothetical protein BY996DRAFT_6469466 [Phakopsora pachyrhizi]|nr:hypothetical protein BY996DRAFT_6452480 [Phakopsora pachyrhizi]KAI8450933.1 hypothetical protein BY996DRAFT_6469466 [Phakopsora pachyrhizi]